MERRIEVGASNTGARPGTIGHQGIAQGIQTERAGIGTQICCAKHWSRARIDGHRKRNRIAGAPGRSRRNCNSTHARRSQAARGREIANITSARSAQTDLRIAVRPGVRWCRATCAGKSGYHRCLARTHGYVGGVVHRRFGDAAHAQIVKKIELVIGFVRACDSDSDAVAAQACDRSRTITTGIPSSASDRKAGVGLVGAAATYIIILCPGTAIDTVFKCQLIVSIVGYGTRATETGRCGEIAFHGANCGPVGKKCHIAKVVDIDGVGYPFP